MVHEPVRGKDGRFRRGEFVSSIAQEISKARLTYFTEIASHFVFEGRMYACFEDGDRHVMTKKDCPLKLRDLFIFNGRTRRVTRITTDTLFSKIESQSFP
jgi:hypothetical protein